MESTKNHKIGRICGLISVCGLDANRTSILRLWEAQSFDNMNEEQLHQCLQFMEEAFRCKRTKPTDAIRKLRSRVLARLTDMGKYATPADWSRVNDYLLQKRICGRLLYMLDEGELKKLINKLRAIADKAAAQDKKEAPNGLQILPVYLDINTQSIPN